MSTMTIGNDIQAPTLRVPGAPPAHTHRRAALAAHYTLFARLVCAAAAVYAVATMLGADTPRWQPRLPVAPAVVLDSLLLALCLLHFHFVQRRGASRLWMQRAWRDFERGTDLLIASALVASFFCAWQLLPQRLWSLGNPLASALLWSGFAAGWLLLAVGAVNLDRVANCARRARRQRLGAARYGIVAGLLLIEWCTPQMSLGHLLFAGALSLYLLCNGGRIGRGLTILRR